METAKTTVETELKLEVTASVQLPEHWPVGLYPGVTETNILTAYYFDTAHRRLADKGFALRLRHGGYDAGWHLKQRLSDNTQQEWQWSFNGTVNSDPQAYLTQMPEQLQTKLATTCQVAAEHLLAVAEIVTVRKTVRLRDDNGLEAYEIADDTVQALTRPENTQRAWREWEVEALQPGLDLEVLSQHLRANGAVNSISSSKIARAVGALLPQALAKQADSKTLSALAVQDLADKLQAQITGQVPTAADPQQIAAQVHELRQVVYQLLR